MEELCVAVGAVGGALLRHKVNSVSSKRGHTHWATMGINICGSFVLGFTTAKASALTPRQRLMIGTGFCGAFTTFSTFSVDVINMINSGQYARATVLVLGTNVISIGAAFVGYRLGGGRFKL